MPFINFDEIETKVSNIIYIIEEYELYQMPDRGTLWSNSYTYNLPSYETMHSKLTIFWNPVEKLRVLFLFFPPFFYVIQ